MHCPDCGSAVGTVTESREACAGCGFSVVALDALFGPDEMVMDQVTDMAGILTEAALRRMEKRLKRFERRFPPLFMCVYVGEPIGPGDLGRFGLWLLNRTRMDTPAGPRAENSSCLLFLVDPKAGEAALQCGYHAEACLTQGGAEQVMGKAARQFCKGSLAPGLNAAIVEAERILRRRHG
ncbi:MAG TPA: TPM domain-containing protein [Verrucomicrobiales bacterium]|nr:TPM domain-containing protein [Verrucomicrobiales bacterium]